MARTVIGGDSVATTRMDILAKPMSSSPMLIRGWLAAGSGRAAGAFARSGAGGALLYVLLIHRGAARSPFIPMLMVAAKYRRHVLFYVLKNSSLYDGVLMQSY